MSFLLNFTSDAVVKKKQPEKRYFKMSLIVQNVKEHHAEIPDWRTLFKIFYVMLLKSYGSQEDLLTES